MSNSGIAGPVEELFNETAYANPVLLFAVAEHKVDLPGGRAASQCDVWGLLKSAAGLLSLSVEAKAKEAFGDSILEKWLITGKTDESKDNRAKRFAFIHVHLPKSGSFLKVRYQLLHRCAAAVIEAKRFGLSHAAFIVQSFDAPAESFADYATFCEAIGLPAARGACLRPPLVR